MSEMSALIAPVVLVVAPPGYYRDSLIALLDATRRTQQVLVAADLSQADSLPDRDEPNVVLLASPARRPFQQPLQPTLERMRRLWPHARIVLLTDSGEDLPVLPLADARLGANASAGDLVELLGDALPGTYPHIPIPRTS